MEKLLPGGSGVDMKLEARWCLDCHSLEGQTDTKRILNLSFLASWDSATPLPQPPPPVVLGVLTKSYHLSC